MKLLLIEDDFDAVKEIKNYYEDSSWIVITSDFSAAPDNIAKEKPDIIVMDWMEDFDNDKNRGASIFEKIHNIPIIVYSGAADSLSLNKNADNPFIEKIAKGDEQVVIQKIEEWEQYLKVVSEVKNQFDGALSFMMASLKPVITMDSYPGDDVIKFMLSKQASEYFNSILINDNKIPAWTQYLYPPSSKKLLVADIIKSMSEEKYFVVLTPSCDMARADDCSKILIASCTDYYKFHDYGQIPDFDPEDKKKGIPKIETVSKQLSYGYNSYRIPLPELPNVFPYLTINLKDLSFVELSSIAISFKDSATEKHKYFRIASINSPYREQIVWAHMVNSCRPGVPDRDYKLWAENILK